MNEEKKTATQYAHQSSSLVYDDIYQNSSWNNKIEAKLIYRPTYR